MNLLEETEIIEADATQIHQILINLCTNAVHAMENTPGVLSLEVMKIHLDDNSNFDIGEVNQGEYVQIIVKDTGSGIDPEIQKMMFDPYFTRKEIGKGTGMGLAIVQGIVLNHHGAISVQSKLDEGTSIRLVFPISHQATTQKQEYQASLFTGSEKILFIDDEESLVRIGKKMLEGMGYSVEAKTDSQEALDLFKSNPYQFDLIITDMTMPHLTGDQLSKQMLEIRSDLPIILCTGFSDKISNEKAIELGFRKFLEKPITKQSFAKTIREILDGIV